MYANVLDFARAVLSPATHPQLHLVDPASVALDDLPGLLGAGSLGQAFEAINARLPALNVAERLGLAPETALALLRQHLSAKDAPGLHDEAVVWCDVPAIMGWSLEDAQAALWLCASGRV